MKRILATHCCWLLITIVAFVAGSQLARRDSQPGNAPNGKTQVDRFLSVAESLQNSNGLTSHEAVSAENSTGSSERTAGQASAFSMPEAAAAKQSGAEELAPLTDSQIHELVLAAIRSSNPVERRKAFDRLLQEMQSESFTVEQAMMMRSTMHENGASGEQWRLFDYAWGANDPAAAVAHIGEISEQHRAGFTGNMLPGLASIDPQTASDLVSGMEGAQRQQMMGRLLEGLADYDVDYAAGFLFELAEDGDPGAAQHMKKLAREVLSTVGLEDSLTWAEGLRDGPLQAAALQRVANEYANEAPREAAQWAEQFVGTEHNSRLFGEVVREWGDVEAASTWVESLEPSQAQRDALSAVYGFRGSQEPHEAVRDIIDMPASEDRNFAINGFISGLAHQDGEAAVTWAAEITSPAMREAAMVRAGQQYYRQDSEAAIEWLGESGLPENTWEKVIPPAPNPTQE